MRYIITELLALASIGVFLYGLWIVHPALAMVIGGIWGMLVAYHFSPPQRAEREKAARAKAEADSVMDRVADQMTDRIRKVVR